MNVGYRVTLTQYERGELGTLLESGGRQAARKLKRAQILLAAGTPASATRRSQPVSASAARRCTAPNGGSWRATWSGLWSEESRPWPNAS